MKRRFENSVKNNVKSKPLCKFFLEGKCTKNPCSFRHVSHVVESLAKRQNSVNIRERVETSMERFHEEKVHLLNVIQWYKLESSNLSEELKVVKQAKGRHLLISDYYRINSSATFSYLKLRN